MTLEHALFYVTHHSETIIQWLFLLILLLAVAIVANTLFGKKTEATADVAHAGGPTAVAAPNPEIQGFLEKILAQTAKLEAVTVDSSKMNPALAAETEAKIQTLKKELASREEELTKARAGGDSKTAEAADKLSARIKELEAKLAEYEILEDDIADLSLYKEENTRLRAELDKMKTGGASAPAATPAPAPQSVATVALKDQPQGAPPPESGEDIVAEFAEAVGQKASANPMADFESAVKLEKKMLGTEKPAPATAPVAAAAAPGLHAVPNAAAPAAEGNDLFAEFANPPEADAPEATPSGPLALAVSESDVLAAAAAAAGAAPAATADHPAEGALDTEKMMAEMAALVSVEPAPGGSALEDGIDIEKMALEATHNQKS